jgi:sulfite reductase alpha subunit-like flavoprotein
VPSIVTRGCCGFICCHCCKQGFWQERALRLQQGQLLRPAVLLYGCRSAGRDLLFHGELQEMFGLGVLSKVLVAYSREAGQPKTYVQVIVM